LKKMTYPGVFSFTT